MTTQTKAAEAAAEEPKQPESTPSEAAQPSETPSESTAPSAAELKAEIARLNQTIKSLEGRVGRGGVDPVLQAQVDDIRLALRRQEFREERRAIRESDLPEAEQTARLSAVEQRERQTEETQSLAEWRRDTVAEMNDDLAASGLPIDDPKILEFAQRWAEATTKAEGQKVRREFNRYLISEPAAKAKAAAEATIAAAETARKRQNHEEGTLKVGVGAGLPGGGGSDYIERVKSGKPLPSASEIDEDTARFLRSRGL